MATSADYVSTFAQVLLKDCNLRVGKGVVMCKKKNGYINATALCNAGDREYRIWKDRKHVKGDPETKTRGFIEELSLAIGIPIARLAVYVNHGPADRATWVHPCVAIDIAYWLSPEFAVKVTSWVINILVFGSVKRGEEATDNKLRDEII